MSALTLLLVEDDELFRLGLATRLCQEPDVVAVLEAEDGEQALELAKTQVLSAVVLDIGLPGLGGVETCQQLHQHDATLPILILTSHSQPDLIAQLLRAGAAGYCLKGVPAEALLLAVRSVVAGASWWDEMATDVLRQQSDSRQPTRPLPTALTNRELEILALMAEGLSNSDIATRLYISAGTVRVHVHAILHKLGVRDRTQAVILALRNRWIA